MSKREDDEPQFFFEEPEDEEDKKRMIKDPKTREDMRRPVPGNRSVCTTKAYCSAWRLYAEPLAELTGWPIHSFNKDIKFVSPDYQFTQAMGIPFIEALVKAIRKRDQAWNRKLQRALASNSNAPSSSAAYRIPLKPLGSQPSSTDPSTKTSDTKAGSSAPASSPFRSRTSSR
jgi:hypothetical protein